MGLVEGRVAVVTGGANGIGLSIAERLAEEGAKVVIGDIADTSSAVASLGQKTEAVGYRCDVTSRDDVQGLVQQAVDSFGSVGIMVNNAGITRDATLRKMTDEEFDQVIDVHLKGCWYGTRFASLVMRDQQHGSIVNISSLSGKVGMIGQTNYSAAKAGIIGLTKAAAKELAYRNVRVNAVQPGLIRTAMTESLPDRIWDQKQSEIPMLRAGEPDEVANVVLFYASELSSYMTGTVAEVTGGRFM